jgi:hypothetical protein
MADDDKKDDGVNKGDNKVNGQDPQHFKHIFSTRDDKIDYSTISAMEGPSKFANQIKEAEKLLKLPLSQSNQQHVIENIEQVTADQQSMIEHLQESENIKANRTLAQGIRTKTRFGNVNTRTTTMAGSASVARRVKENPRDMYRATEEIEARNATLMEEVGIIGESMADRSKTLAVGEEAGSEFSGDVSRVKSIEEEIAYNKRLLRQQSRSGLSTEKLINRGEDLDASVSDFLNKKGIEDKVDRGDIKSYGEEFQSMGEKRSARNKAQEEYDKAIESGAENIAEFAEKLKDANDGLDKQTRIVKRMSEKGMDKDDGIAGKARTVSQWAGVIGMGAQAATTVGVDYEIQQTQMRAGFANIANRQYEDTRAMSKGDMGAFLRLSKTDEFTASYGKSLRDRAEIFGGAEVAAQTAQGIANGVAAGSDPLGYLSGGKKVLAIANAAGAPLIQAGLKGTQLGYNLTGGSAELRAREAGTSLGNALNAIPANTMNAYMGGMTGFYEGGTGIGGGRGAFMQSMQDKMGDFTKAGVNYQKAAQLGGLAINQIGVTEDATDAALKAAKVEQRGVMSAEQYISAAGSLSNVGGGTANMEDMMAKAMTIGVENAKNLNQMVDATISMSQSSAAVGYNVADVAQDRLTASMKSMTDRGISENMATAAAKNAFGSFQAGESQMGTFADYKLRADVQGLYGNSVDSIESAGFAKMSTLQIDKILNGEDRAEAYRIARDSGISEEIGLNKDGTWQAGSKEKFKDFKELKVRKSLTDQVGTAAAFSYKDQFEEMVDFTMGRKDRSQLDEKTLGLFRTQTDNSLNYIAGGKSVKGTGPTNMSVDEKAIMTKGIVGAKFDQQEFEAGKKRVGDDLGGLTELVNMMIAAVNANNPEKMAEEVNKAAKNMEGPAGTFTRASDKFKLANDKFEATINSFITQLDKMGVGGDKSALNALPKDGGSKKSPKKSWGGNSGG